MHFLAIVLYLNTQENLSHHLSSSMIYKLMQVFIYTTNVYLSILVPTYNPCKQPIVIQLSKKISKRVLIISTKACVLYRALTCISEPRANYLNASTQIDITEDQLSIL